MEQEYIIACKDEPSVDKLIEEIITPGLYPLNCPGLSGFNPVEEYMPYSDTQVIFKLTENEAEILRGNPLIVSIDKKVDVEYGFYDNVQTGQQKDLVTVYDASIFLSEETNWGFARCSSLSGSQPWNKNFKYRKTGKNVDVVIVDGGITRNHPEYGPSSRVKTINWSLFSPLTSQTTLNVSVVNNRFAINGVASDTVYVVKDAASPTRFRTQVYNFVLDGTTTLGRPFYIGTAIGSPYGSSYVTNNGADSGTVTLTVYSAADASSLGLVSNPNTMYYFGIGGFIGGIISRTDYNTQADNEFFYTDQSGHGSHVTGTVAGSAYGWAPNADIYSIKLTIGSALYGYPGNGTGIARAFGDLKRWHLDKISRGINRPTVTNHSYGTTIGTNDPVSDNATKDLTDNGIHFVHAAGNSYGFITTPTDPAYNTQRNTVAGLALCRGSSPCYPSSLWTNHENNPVHEVGALGSYDGNPNVKADYSNYGPGVSIYAPGTYVLSVWPNQTYGNYIIPGWGIRKINGTSMASPQVCGVLATILEDHPNLSPQEAKNFLRSMAIVDSISASENHILFNSTGVLKLHSLEGSKNLTLNQYPPEQIIIRYPSIIGQPGLNPNFAKFATNCYIKTNESFNLNNMRYSTNQFMNSAWNVEFNLSQCP